VLLGVVVVVVVVGVVVVVLGVVVGVVVVVVVPRLWALAAFGWKPKMGRAAPNEPAASKAAPRRMIPGPRESL
jgi:hypothetical protein